MNTKSNFWMKFALAICGMALMVDLAIYPAADAIYTVFADQNIVLVNYIITGPSLMCIFGSLLCGVVAQKVGKKKIICVSYLVFCICATCGGLIDNVYYLVFTRTCVGLACGFINIAAAGLIAELFLDEASRSKMIGIYTGVMSALGALMSFVAGYIVLIDWHYVFFIYAFAVPILLLLAKNLPDTPPEAELAAEEGDGDNKVNWLRPLGLAIAAIVLNAAYAVVLTMMAVFLEEQQIGDAAMAGTMGMITTLGSMVASFMFSMVYMKFKRKTPILFALAMGIGFIVLAATKSLTLIAAAAFIMGGVYGMSFSYYLMHAANIVPASKSSISIAIANAAVYFGIFIGPYVCPFYEKVFGVDTMAACMPYIAITCFIYAVLSIGINIKLGKQAEA